MSHVVESRDAGHGESLNCSAIRATAHCLTGCAIGEVLGMVIATALAWGNSASIAISVVLAFVFGYALTLGPILRAGVPLRGRLESVGCRGEGDEEGIALRVHLDSALRGARLAHDPAVLGERSRVRLRSQLVQQPRRPSTSLKRKVTVPAGRSARTRRDHPPGGTPRPVVGKRPPRAVVRPRKPDCYRKGGG
jgi:hypothetical protein